MITFAPGTETHALNREHRAVRMLDRVVRHCQSSAFGNAWRSVDDLQFVRKALAGKPLRAYLRSGKRSKQKRLAL